jgi:hypothetical protein
MISLSKIAAELVKNFDEDVMTLLSACHGEIDTKIYIVEPEKKDVKMSGGDFTPETFTVKQYNPQTVMTLRDRLKNIENKFMPKSEKYIDSSSLSGGSLKNIRNVKPAYNLYPYVLHSIF